jgi:signal transduction histidine kinase
MQAPDRGDCTGLQVILTFVLAIIATALATGIRFLFYPILGDHHAFILYLLPTLFAAWLGGWKPAVLVLLLGLIMGTYLFVKPPGTLRIESLEEQLGLICYLIVGGGSILLAECLHAAQRQLLIANVRLKEANIQLRERAAEALRVNQERLQSIAATARGLEREILEIAALEQQRIGRDLHDGIGQELTGLGLMAGALAQRLESTPELAELAAKITAGFERVHAEVRSLSQGLIPVEVGPEGLRSALVNLAKRTSEQSGTECTLASNESCTVADAATANHLFRIVQEAVSNALRHGHPHHIWITLHAEAHTLILSIRDDGTGFAGCIDEKNGLGIRLMKNRAGQIGGTLTIGSAAGSGTLVTCTLARGKYDGS